jgi:CheY-like chemotaxis protein
MSLNPRKILLVDDEQYVTSLVAAKLRALGDHVTTAGDGEEALPLATSLLPDLIVSDLQMPIMTGFELACELKKQPETAEIPVILLTARGHLVEAGEMSQTNIRQLLAKPFSAKELVAKIEELIGPPRQGELPIAV